MLESFSVRRGMAAVALVAAMAGPLWVVAGAPGAAATFAVEQAGPAPTGAQTSTTSRTTDTGAVKRADNAADEDLRLVWSIVAGLVAIAVALTVLTVLYWRRTRPDRSGDAAGDRPVSRLSRSDTRSGADPADDAAGDAAEPADDSVDGAAEPMVATGAPGLRPGAEADPPRRGRGPGPVRPRPAPVAGPDRSDDGRSPRPESGDTGADDADIGLPTIPMSGPPPPPPTSPRRRRDRGEGTEAGAVTGARRAPPGPDDLGVRVIAPAESPPDVTSDPQGDPDADPVVAPGSARPVDPQADPGAGADASADVDPVSGPSTDPVSGPGTDPGPTPRRAAGASTDALSAAVAGAAGAAGAAAIVPSRRRPTRSAGDDLAAALRDLTSTGTGDTDGSGETGGSGESDGTETDGTGETDGSGESDGGTSADDPSQAADEDLERASEGERRRRVSQPAKELQTPDAERVLLRPGQAPVRVDAHVDGPSSVTPKRPDPPSPQPAPTSAEAESLEDDR